MSLFDTQDLAEIAHPDYPGERLIACRNPALATSVPENATTCWRHRNPPDPYRATGSPPAPGGCGQDR